MRPASREDIKGWLRECRAKGKRYLIVVCDDFDYSDYPVYTDTPLSERRSILSQGMQRIMECYDLALDLQTQLGERRALHWPASDPEAATK